MDQPTGIQPMNTSEAESAIEGLLSDDVETEAEVEVEPVEETGQVEESEEAKVTEESEEAEEQETTEEVSEEQEQDSIETLADLAEALELPLEEVMANLKTTVKVNGEELPVTLKEAFDGYQKDADYRNKTGELATQKREFEQASQQARQQLEEQLLQFGHFIQNAEQMFVPALDQAQMEQLKQTDPQRYLIAKHEHDERVGQVQQLKELAASEYAKNQQALQEQQSTASAEYVEKAREELLTRIPEWNGELKTSVDNYLMGESYGYSAEELSHVVDPRLVEMAHKAMLYDKSKTEAKVVTKKVKTLPKIQPKAPQGKVSPKSDAISKAKARLKKSGSIDDAAALLEQLL
jgi:hypothetical protein